MNNEQQLSHNRDKLRQALSSMVESYDILIKYSPLAKNEIAVGVIEGSFAGTIQQARQLLSNTSP